MKKLILSVLFLSGFNSLKGAEPTPFQIDSSHKFLDKAYLESLPDSPIKDEALKLKRRFEAASLLVTKIFEKYTKLGTARFWHRFKDPNYAARFINDCHVLASLETIQSFSTLESLGSLEETTEHVAASLIVRPHVSALYLRAALFIEKRERENNYALEITEQKAEIYYRIFLSMQKILEDNLSDESFQAIYNEAAENGPAYLTSFQKKLKILIERWGLLLVEKTEIDPSNPVDLSDFPWDLISVDANGPQTGNEAPPKKRMRQEKS